MVLHFHTYTTRGKDYLSLLMFITQKEGLKELYWRCYET